MNRTPRVKSLNSQLEFLNAEQTNLGEPQAISFLKGKLGQITLWVNDLYSGLPPIGA